MFCLIMGICSSWSIILLFWLSAAVRELRALSTKPFAIPGEAGFPVGGLFPAPANRTEAGTVHVHATATHIFGINY